MIHRLILCLTCASNLAFAQPKPLQVLIDGKLTDSVWQQMPASSLTPAEAGIPTDLGGEVRTAVIDGTLYFSARMPEPSGRMTARSIGVNPNWEEGEDHLRVHISSNLAPSDWVLRVNPLGAYLLEWKGQFI